MKIDPLKIAGMPSRCPSVAILPAVLLLFGACAHQRAVEPPAVEAAQFDSPAISPWAEPLPNGSVEEDPEYTATPGP